MDDDPRRPFPHNEEEEPERRHPARTPPLPKKPLDVFLAEFDRRLAEHPDEPATDTHLELEARAEGARRPPMASPRPPLAATLEATPRAEGPTGLTEAEPVATSGPPLDPGAEAPVASPTNSEGDVDGGAEPNSTGTDPAAPAAANQRRQPRGRRHRRRRH